MLKKFVNFKSRLDEFGVDYVQIKYLIVNIIKKKQKHKLSHCNDDNGPYLKKLTYNLYCMQSINQNSDFQKLTNIKIIFVYISL